MKNVAKCTTLSLTWETWTDVKPTQAATRSVRRNAPGAEVSWAVYGRGVIGDLTCKGHTDPHCESMSPVKTGLTSIAIALRFHGRNVKSTNRCNGGEAC